MEIDGGGAAALEQETKAPEQPTVGPAASDLAGAGHNQGFSAGGHVDDTFPSLQLNLQLETQCPLPLQPAADAAPSAAPPSCEAAPNSEAGRQEPGTGAAGVLSQQGELTASESAPSATVAAEAAGQAGGDGVRVQNDVWGTILATNTQPSCSVQKTPAWQRTIAPAIGSGALPLCWPIFLCLYFSRG